MRFVPAYTSQFKKDFKRCEKRGLDMAELHGILSKLLADQPLAPKHRPHVLKGEFHGCWECHVRPDWLLIWVRNESQQEIQLVRTGTHPDLFD